MVAIHQTKEDFSTDFTPEQYSTYLHLSISYK